MRNAHSSCFIEPEKLIVLLHDLAARIGTASDEYGYGDNRAVRLENGRKALDYMGAAWRDDHPDNIQATHFWRTEEKGSTRMD
jgi:hypothetical protein